MAKDQTALLQEISNQLKKMNQTSVREKLQQQSMVERQEAILAGAQNPAAGESSAITDAQDFKRRFVAGRAGAIFDKRLDLKSPSEKLAQKDLKNQKRPSVATKEKKIGIFDVNTTLKKGFVGIARLLIANHQDTTKESRYQLGTLDEIAMVLRGQFSFWLRIYKIREMDEATKQRLLAERDKERRKEKFMGKLNPQAALPSPGSLNKGMGFGALALRALPALVIAGVVALAVGAITDFVTGWKEDGLSGAIGKGLGGAGEGVWNSIKQSFKVGGLGATIGGAIGFLFGGVGAIPGAIIGGIIGMAVGAVAGYFGGDKITQGLKDAGKAVGDAWNETKHVFNKVVNTIANWIYTPGQSGNQHNDATKTSMFGGIISWEAGNFSGTVAAAWQNAKDSISTMMTDIGHWFYKDGQLFGGAFTMPSFDLTGFDEGLSDMWKTLKDIPGKIKKSLMNLFPEWMQRGLGWISASTNMGPNGDQHPEAFDSRTPAQKFLRVAENIPTGLVPMSVLHSSMSLTERYGTQNPELDIIKKDEDAKAKALIVATKKANKQLRQITGVSPGHPSMRPIVTDASTNKGAVTVNSFQYYDHMSQISKAGQMNNANGIVTEIGEIWSHR